MLFVIMGFRNVFRNKRRSILTCTVVGLGLAALILADGIMQGMNENMVRTITTGIVSQGQIHHPEFQESFRVEDSVLRLDDVKSALDANPLVASYSERIISRAMISSPRNMKNVVLFGVDPDQENHVSTLHQQIIDGAFVEDEKSLVVGVTLLKRLEAEIGDKVVITTTEAHTGELAQELFRITGVLRSGSNGLDKSTAFIHKNQAQRILSIGKNVHEIALSFHDRTIAERDDFPLWSQIKDLGNSAKSWRLILSSFVAVMKMTDQSMAIIALILMLIVGLGIVNSLFMALYERIFEFGVMRALGTGGREIVIVILSEAVFLALLSVLLGLVITACTALPLYHYGLDYGGFEFAKVTIRDPIRYSFSWHQYTVFPTITIVFTTLVALYPAVHAVRLTVSQALKRSL